MTDPKRILDAGDNDLDVAMLRAARQEGLPPHLLEKALVSVGIASAATVGGAGLSAASTGAAAGAASTGAAAGAASTGAGAAGGAGMGGAGLGGLSWLSAGAVAKWGGSILVVAALGGGTMYVASEVDPALPAPSPPPAEPVPPTPEGQVASEGQHAPEGVVAPAPAMADTGAVIGTPVDRSDAPAKAADPPKVAQAPAPTTAAPLSGALGAEVARLDSARRALRAGDASGCIRHLDVYRAEFPTGKLAAEAAALRVEALGLLGDTAGAAAAAASFHREHPHSPHAARVDAVVGAKNDAPSNP